MPGPDLPQHTSSWSRKPHVTAFPFRFLPPTSLQRRVARLEGSSALIRFGFPLSQPQRNFSVEHKVEVQRGFVQEAPRSVVCTKLDKALPHTVFVGIAPGKRQKKRWQGIR